MMVRMGIKFGKIRVCAGMALTASGDSFFSENSRLRIVDRQDIVRSMANGALGCRAVAKIRQLAMQAQEILFGEPFVAVATPAGQYLAKPHRFGIGKLVP